ncbi:SCO6880 family protein [Amycolatopsis anabasis]|uniref:SCO6880 family protein n=1 Tax=Amycolatopsis anabasis TaxID=1840409 RepID=UPI00131C35FD|nr:SCO6880 family protein [Amycolatopsis anabasis]
MTTSIRIYKGLSRREHAGWIIGLTPVQAAVCLVLAVPIVIALAAGELLNALILAAICLPLAALVVIPVHGRPALRWLGHLILFQAGITFGWSRWQSKAASGIPVNPDEPDIPGVLARVRFPDGPPLRDQGRVCLIHDTGEGRWGATARLTHTGVGMLSDAQCERLAARLGNLLLSIGHREVIDRMSLLVRTVPDDGQEYEAWRARHEVDTAPELARQATHELDRTVGAVSVRHEVFVTISGSEESLRKPAAAAGGGVAGRAAVLYRVLDGLEDKLKALGAHSVTWLSGPALAEAIRTGFNPAAAGVLAANRHTADPTKRRALPWAAAGPTHAPAPSARAYHHDGFSTVGYSVLMPEAGTVFGSLGALLAVKTAGERRSLAVHYEVLSQRKARSAVRGNRFRSGVVSDWKTSKGFNTNAEDNREARGARAQERAVAAGHAIVRYAVTTAVTVPSAWNVEDHAARVENDVAGRFRLLRMELAQDSTFVAAVLPVGIGLPRLRGGVL